MAWETIQTRWRSFPLLESCFRFEISFALRACARMKHDSVVTRSNRLVDAIVFCDGIQNRNGELETQNALALKAIMLLTSITALGKSFLRGWKNLYNVFCNSCSVERFCILCLACYSTGRSFYLEGNSFRPQPRTRITLSLSFPVHIIERQSTNEIEGERGQSKRRFFIVTELFTHSFATTIQICWPLQCWKSLKVIIKFVFKVLLILLTIFGNILVVLSVFMYKRMRTFTNILLTSLATAG